MNILKKVSIILPVYNGEKYLSKSIDSIIGQTYTDWELIIINDCSTDNTLKICKDYAKKDKRIKAYTNKENLKLPNSLNEGFKRASGKYYTWTSDDNMYKPEAVETMVNYLEENQGYVMIYTNYTTIDADDNVIENVKLREPKYLMTGANCCGACFLYRGEIAKRVGEYDASLFLAEDFDYWVRIAKLGKIKHLKKDLYLYRVHNASLTGTRINTIKEQTFKLIEKHFLLMYVESKKSLLSYKLFNNMMLYKSYSKELLKQLCVMDKVYLFFYVSTYFLNLIKRVVHKIQRITVSIVK